MNGNALKQDGVEDPDLGAPAPAPHTVIAPGKAGAAVPTKPATPMPAEASTPVPHTHFDLVAVLRDWSRSVRAMVGTELSVAVETDRATCPMHGDRQALHEALARLSAHALHHLRRTRQPARRLHLRLGADRLADGREAVVIAIRDHGCGLDEGLLEQAFSPVASGPGAAPGHALALVRNVAKAHGGELRMAERGVEGSEFLVVLPVDTTTPAPAGATMAVLLVGGDRLSLDVTSKALRALGCTSLAAPNAAAALRALHAVAFTAVVLDAGLGADQIARVAQACRLANPRIRVVVLEGRGQSGSDAAGVADRVLRKPCGAWDLLHALRDGTVRTEPSHRNPS